jgi:hypothetical protein
MSDQKPSGWKLVHGQDVAKLPPEVQQRIATKRQGIPAVEIHIKLLDLDKGHAEVSIEIAQEGSLAKALADTTTRATTSQQIITAVQRELNDALTTLLDA